MGVNGVKGIARATSSHPEVPLLIGTKRTSAPP